MLEVQLSGSVKGLRLFVLRDVGYLSVETLRDFEGVFVELIAEVAVEFQVERSELHEELLEIHQVVDALVHHLVDLELEELGIFAVLAFEDDRIVLANELVVDLHLS